MRKPLRGKAYGSIPHLHESRIGPGAHHVHHVTGCEPVWNWRPSDIVTPGDTTWAQRLGLPRL